MSKLRNPSPLVHVGLPAPSKTRNPAPICPSQCSFTSELSTRSRSGKYFLFASPGTDCQIRMTCWAEFRLLQLLYICSEKQINYLKCNGNKRLKIEGPVDAMWNLCIFPISSELTIRVEWHYWQECLWSAVKVWGWWVVWRHTGEWNDRFMLSLGNVMPSAIS